MKNRHRGTKTQRHRARKEVSKSHSVKDSKLLFLL